MLPFPCVGDAIAHYFVVDMVRWLWRTSAQAFLDRDGAVGPPNARDRPGCGSMGTPTHGHGSWLFKAGGHVQILAFYTLLYRPVRFLRSSASLV